MNVLKKICLTILALPFAIVIGLVLAIVLFFVIWAGAIECLIEDVWYDKTEQDCNSRLS